MTVRSDRRIGDQLFFVADTRALQEALGWQARTDWRAGLRDLHSWLLQDWIEVSKAQRQPRRVTA
jgi:CDP-paratose 2-epimerase